MTNDYPYTSTSIHEDTKERLKEYKKDDESWTECYERILDAIESRENGIDVSERSQEGNDPSNQEAANALVSDVIDHVRDLRVLSQQAKRKYENQDQDGLSETLNALDDTTEDLAELLDA